MNSVDFTQLKVLVVEDEAFAQKFERLVLERLGIRKVMFVNDGYEALAYLERHDTFDLIISDWKMPKMSGIELLRTLRVRMPAMPFLMLTGNSTAEAVIEAAVEGVDAYLAKPCTPQQMGAKIASALRRRATP